MRIVRKLDGYTVEQGWSDDLASDLVYASREVNIKKFTPNDAERRFQDSNAAQNWYDNPEKQPVVYTLRDNIHRQLGGIAWFSHGQNDTIEPLYDTTFAIRLYDAARGQGLSYPFASAAHDDFIALPIHGRNSRVWLETSDDNLPAQRLYKKLGYQTLARVDKRLVMGLQPQQ